MDNIEKYESSIRLSILCRRLATYGIIGSLFLGGAGLFGKSVKERSSSIPDRDLEERINTGVTLEKPIVKEEDIELKYGELLREIAEKKTAFKEEYLSSSPQDREKVLDRAKEFVFDSLVDRIFPLWYGTRWDFNGATRVPRRGSIACGYFVTTTLQDVGFNIPRTRLAQQPSENVIKNLCRKDEIRRFSNKDIKDIEAYIHKKGGGIYIVGMDIHIGFIVNRNGKIRFVHSSYYTPPHSVVSEPLDSRNPLRDSKYRVIGKISYDMIREWTIGRRFKVTYDYFKKNHSKKN